MTVASCSAQQNIRTRFKEHQQVLAALIDKGATVLVCPMCMEHYGVNKTDLSPGLSSVIQRLLAKRCSVTTIQRP